jgi:hypothetical protein
MMVGTSDGSFLVGGVEAGTATIVRVASIAVEKTALRATPGF